MSANLGYYELMDRIALIQGQLEDYVANHEVADDKLQKLVNDAQVSLSDAYSYVAEKFNDSCEDDEDYK